MHHALPGGGGQLGQRLAPHIHQVVPAGGRRGGGGGRVGWGGDSMLVRAQGHALWAPRVTRQQDPPPSPPPRRSPPTGRRRSPPAVRAASLPAAAAARRLPGQQGCTTGGGAGPSLHHATKGRAEGRRRQTKQSATRSPLPPPLRQAAQAPRPPGPQGPGARAPVISCADSPGRLVGMSHTVERRRSLQLYTLRPSSAQAAASAPAAAAGARPAPA
jgi:hypothetical protein